MNQLDDAAENLVSIIDFLRWAATRFNEAKIFYGHGTYDAWSEALALILPALHLETDLPDVAWHARLTKQERLYLLELITKRVEERIPSAYLVHHMRFAGLDFYVDERALIPRSPIAELIEKRFEPWVDSENTMRILDLCTGSGCIAIACAHYFPHAKVDAVDISKDALVVAQTNVAKYQLNAQVRLLTGDLFAAIPKNTKYDLIVSNPPYVDAQDMAELPKEYHYEPTLGLTGGADGLDIVKKILRKAKDYLKPEGILVVEVGNSEAALMEQFPHVPFTWLEFARSDGGVFLLTYQDLVTYI